MIIKNKLSGPLFASFLVVFVVLLAACMGPEERKTQHLERAQQFFDQGNYAKARVELKNVLQIDPDSVEGYWLYANVKEKEKDYRNAFSAFNKVAELDPSHINSRLRLAQIFAATNSLERANEMLAQLLLLDKNNLSVQIVQAQIMAREGDVDAALEKVKGIFSSDKTQSSAARLMAALYAQQGTFDRAEETLRKAVEASPQNSQVKITLADLLIKSERYIETEELLKEIAALEPKELRHRDRLAELYIKLKRLDDAEKTLRVAVNDTRAKYSRILKLVSFLQKYRSNSVAIAELEAQIISEPKNYKLRFALGVLQEKDNNHPAAHTVYENIIALDEESPNVVEAYNRLSVLQLQLGNVVKATEYNRIALKRSPGDLQGLLVRGKIALANLDYESAIVDFRVVAQQMTMSGEIMGLLAQAYTQNNQKELALETLQQTLKANPENFALKQQYIKVLSALGENKMALKTTSDLKEKLPGNVRLTRQQINLHIRSNEIDKAELLAKKLANENPDNLSVLYSLGQVQTAKKQFNKATSSFSKIYKQEPDNKIAFEALIKSYIAQRKFETAINLTKQRIKSTPNDAGYYNGLGELFLAQGSDVDKAIAAFKKAISLKSTWLLLYLNLGKSYVLDKDYEKTQQTYQRGLLALPGNIQLEFAVAATYELQKKYEEAIIKYDSILAKNPQHTLSRNNLASILTEWKGDEASVTRALWLVQSFEKSNNPFLLDTLGWVYHKQGKNKEAGAIFDRVSQNQKLVSIIEYHVGMVNYKNGDSQKAITYLKRAVKSQEEYKGKDVARATLSLLQ